MAIPGIDDLADSDFFGGVSDVTGGLHRGFFGDPDAIKRAYDEMMGKATDFSRQNQAFLSGQQQKALSYYSPVQDMFRGAYGTKGLQAPQVPQNMAGLGPMYGGK